VGAVLLGCLTAPGLASAAAELTLLGSKDGKATYNFGESRSKRNIVLVFEASEPVTSPPSVVLSDAKAEDKLFEGSLSAAAEVVGEKIVKVNVTVEPGSTSEGSYSADVLLRGKEISGTNARLVLDFDRCPPEWAAWILACLALGIGVILGGFLKWLAGTGAKLRLLVTRYELLTTSFDGNEWTPPVLKAALAEVQVWLAVGEVEKAEEKLNAIEGKAEATLAVMRTLAELATKITEGEARVERMQSLEPGAESRLKNVLKKEREWLEKMRNAAYPDPSAETSSRAERAGQIDEFDLFLGEYADPDKREGKWEEALAKYWEGDFAGAKAKWSTPGPAGAVPSAGKAPASVVEGPGLLAKAKWFAVRNAPTIAGVLVAFGVIVVGLQTVFDVEAMFLTNDVRDFLTLMAWGFGSALAGLTTTELASKVLPKSPAQ
jgi:hypothetical protein